MPLVPSVRRVIGVAMIATGFAVTGVQAQQTQRPNLKTLVVTQTVTGPESGAVSSIEARQGSYVFSGTASAVSRGFEPVPNAASIASIGVFDYGSGRTRSQLLAEARVRVLAQVPALVQALRTYAASTGAATAAFNLDQRVRIAGSARPSHLVWTMVIDAGGRAFYGNPRLHDEHPLLLYALYTPKSVAQGLPASWAYPDAGALKYQLVDQRMEPQTAFTVVDTGGAFDEPGDLSGGPVDPDALLKCLVDRASSPGCPAGYPDVRGLIDQSGASGAMLDYVRTLKPLYDSVETPPGSGEFEHSARVSLQIDSRKVELSGCGNIRYTNQGAYGFALQEATDRFYVSAEGTYAQVNRFTQTRLSPTQSYSKQTSVPRSAYATLAQYIISPAEQDSSLLAVSEVPNLVSLAPLSVSGNQSDVTASGADWLVSLEIRCSTAGDGYIARAMVWRQCRSGGCNSLYFPVELHFNRGQPAAVGPVLSALTYRSQRWEPISIHYNGADTVQVSHRALEGRLRAPSWFTLTLDGRIHLPVWSCGGGCAWR